MSIVCFVCWFFLLGFFVLIKKCSLTLRRHQCRWRVANFDLCSALMGYWAVRFIQRATPTMTRVIRLYWSSPRTRYTRSHYCRAFNLAMELSLPVFTTEACRALDSNTKLPLAKRICRLLNNELIIVKKFLHSWKWFLINTHIP